MIQGGCSRAVHLHSALRVARWAVCTPQPELCGREVLVVRPDKIGYLDWAVCLSRIASVLISAHFQAEAAQACNIVKGKVTFALGNSRSGSR